MAEPASSTESSADAPSARVKRARLYGRRIAQAVYYALAAALAMAFTVQITNQVFFAPETIDTPHFQNCEEGLDALYQAIERGRAEAQRGSEGEPNEEAALARYRAQVQPAWRHRVEVAQLCRGDESGSLLDALERLRYSEEHGVRRQAAELTELRQRVRRMFTEQRSKAAPPPAPRQRP